MKSFLQTLILLTFLLVVTQRAQPQAPPHPNNGNTPTTGPGGNTPVGAGATIADGQFILLALGMAYAARKWHDLHKKKAGSPA